MYFAHLDCTDGIELRSLLDTSEEHKYKARMYLNLIFVADSADGVNRHPNDGNKKRVSDSRFHFNSK